MVEKNEEKKQPVSITYVEQEVDYQEDMLGKLMSLDHVLSMLSRDDPVAFLQNILEIKNEYQQLYNYFINLKRQGVQFPESMGYAPAPEPEEEKSEEES